ncbi:hypothetical protein [Mycolicibacterium sp.]|uniref:hypothetical protein n=1 Tax=Mycolicibacterium sp. TaxID=2320850 RepID=UPI00355D9464
MSDFDSALARHDAVGSSKALDADLMAAFCRDVLQQVVGAASPKLVWEGARKKGLTTRELAELAIRDVLAVSDLQWL